MSSSIERAIDALSGTVATLFREIHNHHDFSCSALTQMMAIHFRGEKVGGFDRRTSVWYFSKVFVAAYDGENILKEYKFKKVLERSNHEYWARSGANSCVAFRSALNQMTGISL